MPLSQPASAAATTGAALDASFQQITANGTLGALNANIAISVGRRSTLTVHTTGTWSGTISLQVSLDGGTTWVTINAGATWTRLSTGAYASTITANDIWQTGVTGFTSLRLVMTSFTSGVANVYMVASDEPAAVSLDLPLPPGGNTVGTVNFGQAGGQTMVAKASGTAAATTDVSLVIQESPNRYSQASAISTNTAASTNATSTKTSAGSLLELTISNPTATAAYFKVYNKATAPTVGTDVPVLTIPVGAGALQALNFGWLGKRFTTGIAWAVTGAAADTDTSVTVAGIHIHGTYV